MPDISRLAVILTASSGGFTSGLTKSAADLEGFAGRVESVGSRVATFAGGLAAAGAALLGGLSLGKGFQLAADMETTTVALTTMLGSADKAKALLGDLSKFAAETPFEFPELATAAKKLIAFGSGAGTVVTELKMLGDIASGAGIPIGELAELYGKARVQGRLFGEDINQLSGRGIPIIELLAKQFKVTTAEIKGMVETGQVGFANVQQAFVDLTSAGGKYAGLTAAQGQTLAGLWSTLQDNVGAALRGISETLIKELNVKDGMTALIGWVEGFGKLAISTFGGAAHWVGQHSAALVTLGKVLAPVAAGLAALSGVILAAVAANKAWAASQAIVLALQGPKGWAVLAGAAIAAGVAYAGVSYAFNKISEDAATASAAADGAAASTEKTAAAAGQLDTAAGLANQKNEQLTAGIAALSKKLTEQVGSFGLSGVALDIWRLKQQGATDAMTANVEALNVQLMGLEENKKKMEELGKAAEKIAEDIKEPWEKLYDQLAQVDELQQKGLLTAAQAERARVKATADAGKDAKKDQPKEPGSVGTLANLDVIERRFTAGFTAANTPAADAARKLAERSAKATELTAKNTTALVAASALVASSVGTDI